MKKYSHENKKKQFTPPRPPVYLMCQHHWTPLALLLQRDQVIHVLGTHITGGKSWGTDKIPRGVGKGKTRNSKREGPNGLHIVYATQTRQLIGLNDVCGTAQPKSKIDPTTKRARGNSQHWKNTPHGPAPKDQPTRHKIKQTG